MSPDLRAQRFWRWFAANEGRFRNVRGAQKEQLLDEILAHLHEYHPRLFFQLGGAPDGPTEFIVTAEGEVEFFGAVSQLVAEAPALPGWQFIQFMPPAGFRFVTEYEDIRVEPARCWFLPLTESNEVGGWFGLRVALPNYDAERSATFEAAVRVVLNTALGELTAGTLIKSVEVGSLPSAPEKHGYIELPKLSQYLQRRAAGIATGNA